MWNAVRRSRKIGKTQGGRIRDGKPCEKLSRAFSEDTWRRLSRTTEGLRVLRENPSKGYIHPCTAEQILAVLHRLPPELTRGIKAIILRRLPKKDEAAQVEARRRYSCIILNSFPSELTLTWDRLTSSDRRHYDRWCTNWTASHGRWTLHWSMAELQRYYLYHLLLHEIGHFQMKIVASEREAYAEDFALTWARALGEL